MPSTSSYSSVDSPSGASLNQTGILLKKVDSLFEKIRSSPTLDATTANLLSRIVVPQYPRHTKISPQLLDFRPMKNHFNVSSLFSDEQAFFRARNSSSYDLYDPFSDKKLILDLYNGKNNTRSLIDTVCTIVNNMVNVVSITHNEKNRERQQAILTPNGSQQVHKAPLNTGNSLVSLNPSRTQILNTILSKPSVIVLNNNNNNNNQATASTVNSMPGGADFGKKFHNPFITTTVKNNNGSYSFQQQTSQPQQNKDFQYKTIVKCKSNNKNFFFLLFNKKIGLLEGMGSIISLMNSGRILG